MFGCRRVANGITELFKPDEHLQGNAGRALQVSDQLKMVARGAAGILQGKDLMVIEDAHRLTCYLVETAIAHRAAHFPGPI